MITNDILFYELKQTAREEAQINYPFPPLLYQIVEGFGKAHHLHSWVIRDWNLFKKRIDLIEANQGDPAIYGAAALVASQANQLVSSAVGIGLMIKCIDDLFFQHIEIYKSFQILKNEINHSYPLHKSYKYPCHSISLLPPSWHYKFEFKIKRLYQKMLRILKAFIHLSRALLETVFCERDVYLIVNIDFQARLRACTQLAATILEHQERLMYDTQFLKTEIIKRQLLVDKILCKLGMQGTTEFFLTKIAFEATKNTSQYIPSALQIGKDLISPLCTPGKIHPLFAFPEAEEKSLPLKIDYDK